MILNKEMAFKSIMKVTDMKDYLVKILNMDSEF